MRSTFGLTLILTIMFASGYAYYRALAVCPIPIAYKIGTLDPRFNLTLDEARLATAEAESVWEDATGQNLFTYDEAAKFTVNFIYDERQAFAEAEESTRAELTEAEQVNETISAEYAALVERYNAQQRSYEDRVAIYERRLNRYNETVASYNRDGGAPEAAYAELKQEEAALDAERVSLEAVSRTLNQMVADINEIGERGNRIVERYNNEVATYNDTFGAAREFTQGTYSSDGHIEIYTFADKAELRLVLAHELGHALSIDHVMGSQSVMYFLIGEQPQDLTLSEADLVGFTAVCGEGRVWDNVLAQLRDIF